MALMCLQKGIVSLSFTRYSTFESIYGLLVVCRPLGLEMSAGPYVKLEMIQFIFTLPKQARRVWGIHGREGALLVPLAHAFLPLRKKMAKNVFWKVPICFSLLLKQTVELFCYCLYPTIQDPTTNQIPNKEPLLLRWIFLNYFYKDFSNILSWASTPSWWKHHSPPIWLLHVQ